MNGKYKIFLAALITASPLCAMDWPSPDALMLRNFGSNEQGRPALGTSFEGGSQVLAAESGELIFSSSGRDTASRLPSPLGAWLAVDHGDGLLSIYSRCAETEVSLPQKERLVRGEEAAAAGTSGWSRQNGFYFILYDRRERRWVNPQMIIAPLPDTRPPQIISVLLKDAHKQPVQNGQTRLRQGAYTVFVQASDTRMDPRENPLAPHRIICSVNGVEAGALILETIAARDGALMVYRNGLVPARQVYGSYPAFETGEIFLSRGQANIEIIVQDIAGNSRSAVSRVFVE